MKQYAASAITPAETVNAEWMTPAFLVIVHAVVAANGVQHHHERASRVTRQPRSLSGSRGLRRARRLHRRADWVAVLSPVLGERRTRGRGIIDRMPLPVCRRAASALLTTRGWLAGARISIQLLPKAYHDLTPLHDAAFALPPGARLIGDTASVSAVDAASLPTDTGVRPVTACRAKMRPPRAQRSVHPNLSSRDGDGLPSRWQMGVHRLHARANADWEGAKHGFAPPVVASLIALDITNAGEQSR